MDGWFKTPGCKWCDAGKTNRGGACGAQTNAGEQNEDHTNDCECTGEAGWRAVMGLPSDHTCTGRSECDECPLGKIRPNKTDDTDSCYWCPEGKYSDITHTECRPCPTGKYSILSEVAWARGKAVYGQEEDSDNDDKIKNIDIGQCYTKTGEVTGTGLGAANTPAFCKDSDGLPLWRDEVVRAENFPADDERWTRASCIAAISAGEPRGGGCTCSSSPDCLSGDCKDDTV